MKILHVYRTYFPDPPGGLQEAIRQICLATKQFGAENTVFALSPNSAQLSQLKRPEAHIIRDRSWIAPASCDLGGPSSFLRFKEIANQVDVIHYHFPWPFSDLLHLCTSPRAPGVMTYHSDIVRQRWLSRAYTPLMCKMLSSMSAIIATSPAYARTSRILADPRWKDKVKVIPLGIDESSYPSIGDDFILRRLGLKNSECFFLFIGVLRYYKGLDTLLRAAKAVNAKIVIAGSGPEDANLRNKVQEYRLSNIIFAGQITDAEKVALLKNCLALVLPSHLRSEAYGMVLIEAAMFGKSMISCEIGTGTSFVNSHNETGFVISPQEPEELAAAMKKIQDDVLLSNQFGLNARQRYENLFSGIALGSAYTDLYKKLII